MKINLKVQVNSLLDILLRAFSFAFIIAIGIALRSFGIVDKSAGDVMKKIMLNLTLPAMIIIGFSNIDKSIVSTGTMLLLMFLGLVTSCFMVGVAMVITRRRPKPEQALFMLSLSSYNIGAFCIPFISGFIGLAGQAVAYMFDVGNSIMCTGGTYALAADYTDPAKTRRRFNLRPILQKLFASPPFLTYLLMFFISLCGWQLPERFLTFVSPIRDANTFVAMLMIGLLFKVELKKEYFIQISKILALRLLFAAALAALIYYVLPFNALIRETLVLVSFAPIPSLAPAYTGMCHGDEGLASCANSISILVSLVVITVLAAAMGLSANG